MNLKEVKALSSKLKSTTLADNEEISSDETSGSSSDETSSDESSDEEEFQRHLKYLKRCPDEDSRKEIALSPIFTSAVRRYARDCEDADRKDNKPIFPQHALLGCEADADPEVTDRRLYYNVAVPASIFICGSQGSGKSHTLSCVLESCLIQSDVNQLRRPLTGLVFHYDTFISETGGTPCEAAHLASHPEATVRVLCAPTNLGAIKKTYSGIKRVKVEPLELSESDLNTKRMLDLMAVGVGSMPLYLHVIQRILRDLRIEQQRGDKLRPFNYNEFKRRIALEDLTIAQTVPLNQRLDTLESFMVKKSTAVPPRVKNGTDWEPAAGQLTIVDLSCPCVTSDMACSLFSICLSMFLEKGRQQDSASEPAIGRIVALDEAHKYMTTEDSGAAATLTNNLLATIRLQRHLGLRVVISTQEPTVSPKLLDLCTMVIVHRFTSPDWMKTLRGHLAGGDEDLNKEQDLKKASGAAIENHFATIVKLRVGEALMFAPSAAVGMDSKEGTAGAPSGAGVAPTVKRLGHEALKIRVRQRITADGGQSVMAV